MYWDQKMNTMEFDCDSFGFNEQKPTLADVSQVGN